MEQRDYLLRQVEQLALALKKLFSMLLNVKDGGTQAASTVNQYFSESLGFDVDQLIAIKEEEWIATLQNKMHFDSVNLERLADLLLFIAENNLSPGRQPLLRKCLIAYQYLERSEKTYSFDRNFKIEKIESLINS